MVAIYVVYADIFYLIDVFMNLCILEIASKLNRCAAKRRVLRCILAALLGSMVETLLFFTLQPVMLYLLVSHFVVIPLMTVLVFGADSFKLFFQNALTCYGVALVLGGITEAVENTFRIGNLQFFTGVLLVLLSDKLLQRFYSDMKKKRTYIEVALKNKGKKETALALLDSGNLLKGPDGRTPVHFVDERLWGRMSIDEDQFVGNVGYKTLGSSENTAGVYVADELTVTVQSFCLKVKKPYIAKAERNLFANKRYSIILNSQMEEEISGYENQDS